MDDDPRIIHCIAAWPNRFIPQLLKDSQCEELDEEDTLLSWKKGRDPLLWRFQQMAKSNLSSAFSTDDSAQSPAA
ncbi:hypothetical protein RvY_15417 [Ramazzottius varieornatus]|uniref:Uncharacterized protein n=1 Tax=Ramazzottius varieornatus TaxID=947166 RepID=A0A1D1VZJ2_RAMVA|nr:hypothetical protein RvY_15417 [Ramazzottius varieornatus]